MDSPVCVFKTWSACLIWAEPDWCAAVGVPNVKFRPEVEFAATKVELPKPQQPWTLDLQDPLVRKLFGRIVGLRVVEKSRCQLVLPRVDVFSLSADSYVGQTEVMYLLPNTIDGGENIREQILVKKLEGRWQLTGWQTWDEATDCVYSGYENDPYSAPICNKHAPIYLWALRSEFDERAAKK